MSKKSRKSSSSAKKNTSQQHKTQPKSQTRSKGKPQQKEHGWVLTIAIVLMVLHGLVAAYFYNTYRTETAYLSAPMASGLMALHSILNIVAAVGIYLWKKWGLYIYAGSTILAIVVGLLVVGIWSLFYFLLPAVIVGWILRSKWGYFDPGWV